MRISVFFLNCATACLLLLQALLRACTTNSAGRQHSSRAQPPPCALTACRGGRLPSGRTCSSSHHTHVGGAKRVAQAKRESVSYRISVWFPNVCSSINRSNSSLNQGFWCRVENFLLLNFCNVQSHWPNRARLWHPKCLKQSRIPFVVSSSSTAEVVFLAASFSGSSSLPLSVALHVGGVVVVVIARLQSCVGESVQHCHAWLYSARNALDQGQCIRHLRRQMTTGHM